jgi:phosphate transport system permease protein
MTDATAPAMISGNSYHTSEAATARLRARYAAEARFKYYGLAAVVLAMLALALLLFTIMKNGVTAFWTSEVKLEVFIDPERFDPPGARTPEAIRTADYLNMMRQGLAKQFPEVTNRTEVRQLTAMLSSAASDRIRTMVTANPDLIGTNVTLWVLAHSDFDMLRKGHIARDEPEENRKLKDKQIAWWDKLDQAGSIRTVFNTTFLAGTNSREPELAGMWGAIIGSFYTLGITLLLAFPIGVMSAIYLEEFAPKNKFTDLIEVNINNLAAVPSIVFGLLGLSVFLQFFGLPRSSAVVGGIVLALMSLPVIIISGRAALRAVPPSIRQAAIGLGASRVQVVAHHVLPLALPGMLTGTILAMAHALGETAPLLMIGMNAFIVDIPSSPAQAASVLPVQVFMWADSPERGFTEKTSAAIMILMLFLLFMNAFAIYLRRKFERRW